VADFAMATLPIFGAAPLPSDTPSSANQALKPAPPFSRTSLAKRVSKSKRIILPGLTVESVSGLGDCEDVPGARSWAPAGKLNKATKAATAALRSKNLRLASMCLPSFTESLRSSYNVGRKRRCGHEGRPDPFKEEIISLATGEISAMMLAGRTIMSEYVFFCEDCKKEFTRHLHIAEREQEPVTCPYCSNTHVHQLITAFSAVTSKKS
jgi:putative FmdB family regulatory protein